MCSVCAPLHITHDGGVAAGFILFLQNPRRQQQVAGLGGQRLPLLADTTAVALPAEGPALLELGYKASEAKAMD
eukprot:CAMPEP_0202385360 /NCGR_PEP_ID=MMETSP1127-20130417/60316_1 /ASSEMBLY_ACC=CAM_ASM_000462 /TAXON_ID=3047 /ORGANISM="Dunaliella tertiolecta, Strain CCMP1320" /LENGTH=73 /DNA_ID=CAMNT_0048985479 /DNA_START=77 /DNA_END=299 /DNA_ORIENTATION=+